MRVRVSTVVGYVGLSLATTWVVATLSETSCLWMHLGWVVGIYLYYYICYIFHGMTGSGMECMDVGKIICRCVTTWDSVCGTIAYHAWRVIICF